MHCLSTKSLQRQKSSREATLIGIRSGNKFTERVSLLQCIHDIWARGTKVIVVEEDDACSYIGDNEGTTTGVWLL